MVGNQEYYRVPSLEECTELLERNEIFEDDTDEVLPASHSYFTRNTEKSTSKPKLQEGYKMDHSAYFLKPTKRPLKSNNVFVFSSTKENLEKGSITELQNFRDLCLSDFPNSDDAVKFMDFRTVDNDKLSDSSGDSSLNIDKLTDFPLLEGQILSDELERTNEANIEDNYLMEDSSSLSDLITKWEPFSEVFHKDKNLQPNNSGKNDTDVTELEKIVESFDDQDWEPLKLPFVDNSADRPSFKRTESSHYVTDEESEDENDPEVLKIKDTIAFHEHELKGLLLQTFSKLSKQEETTKHS